MTDSTGRLAALRGRRTAILVALVVVIALVGGVLIYSQRAHADQHALCAEMPDAAGLYAGNAVNIRGVRVGEITSIKPHAAGGVTVGMRVKRRPLSADLKVLAVNNSVLADRRLELVGADAHGGPELAAGTCVPMTRTYTPISISTAFQSFTTMFNKIGGNGPDANAPIGAAITAASAQLSGAGTAINNSIKNLSGLMSNPDQFLGDLRATFDNLAVLTDMAHQNWDALKEVGNDTAQLTFFMARQFDDFNGLFIGLGNMGPALDDIFSKVLPPLLQVADDNKPAIESGLSRIDDLKDIIKNLPSIATGLSASLSRRNGAFQITYAAPRVNAATPSSAALCTVLNKSRPGSCTPKSATSAAVDLSAVVAAGIQGGFR